MDAAGAHATSTPVRYFTALDSTNAEALRACHTGARGPIWFVAESQTAGRGRRGRSWVSEPGNLFATLLLTDGVASPVAAQLSFVAALALHDAACALSPALAARLRLKWPNDLLLDGVKVAGILLEGEATGAMQAVVIGIGVNCAHHPELAGRTTAHLAAVDGDVSAVALFAALTVAMQTRLRQWAYGTGFAAIRTDWLARAANRGEAIVARLPDREIHGVFETLDADGCLLLRLENGTRERIAAADIFPLAETLS